MSNPKVTLLLITVRPDKGYIDHPDWHVLGKIREDLEKQTFKDFELVIVDGLDGRRSAWGQSRANFPVCTIQPKNNLWTRNKKPCISNYRNTGLAHARGELVINLDDCCEIPPLYVELFWRAWEKKQICLSATWPKNGDNRLDRNKIPDMARPFIEKTPCIRGQVYGFGSYPLKLAIELNGYDEAYDGGMYLEDIDWGCRLADYGLKTHFAHIPGFHLPSQSDHDPRVIDAKRPHVKCCNAAWQTNQVWRQVSRANTPELWQSDNGEALSRLLGPCRYMRTEGEKHLCLHWNPPAICEYVKDQYLDEQGKSFALERDPLAAKIFEHPPIRNLQQERKDNGIC